MQKKPKLIHFVRKPSIYTVICFFFIAVTPFTVLGQVIHSVSFERSDIVLTKEIAENGITYGRVSISGLTQTDEVGKPSLPVKYVRLIVPSEQSVETIVLGEIKMERITLPYPIFPVQEPIPICIDCPKPAFVEPDPTVYESDKPYPSEIVKIVHDGYFDGSNHIVTVAVYPIQYQPASGVLIFFSYVDFEIRMKGSSTRAIRVESRNAKNQEIYNSILKTTIDNPHDLLMYQITPTLIETTPGEKVKLRDNVPTYEYIIITSDSLKPYFDDFVSWKIRKGLDVGVVTVEEITTNYPDGDEISGINDEAGSVRQYLCDAYQDGTVYALLAGDHTIMPVRYGWSQKNSTQPHSIIPAELYFADFTGDWNVDNDMCWGERIGDSVDYSPEIFVGRLPCVDGDDIINWTEKVLQYEQNPGNGNRDYLTSSFLVRCPGLFSQLKITEIIQHIPSAFDTTVWRQNYTIHKGSEVVTEMNNHGLIQWMVHGAPNSIKVHDTVTVNKFVWTTDTSRYFNGSSDEEGDGLDNMTNTDYYSIVYTGACDVAAFDDYLQEDYPGRCMAEGWLCFESICGPAFLANSRWGWAPMSGDLLMGFYDLLTLGTDSTDIHGSYLHLGVSELISKLNYIGSSKYDHYLSYSHNLYGCPETQIWTEDPSEFTSVSIADSGTNIIVNAGVSGCDICVCSIDNGETYHMVAYNTSSYIFTTSERPVYVTITKPNYIPYMILLPIDLVLQNITVGIDSTKDYVAYNSITAAGDTTYFIIEGNGSTGGNVTMQTGNHISLLPGFETQTGCSFQAYINNPVLSDEHITDPLDIKYKPDSSSKGGEIAEGNSKETKESIPKVFSCAQNYPNPFTLSATIKYGLPKDANVSLEIYNLAGQKVKTLVNVRQSAGFKSVKWDGKNSAGTQVPQGVYFSVFKAADFEKHHKMILLK